SDGDECRHGGDVRSDGRLLNPTEADPSRPGSGSRSAVPVEPDALDGEPPRLEAEMEALVGLVAVQPADVLPRTVDEVALLAAEDPDGVLAGRRRAERDDEADTAKDELVRAGADHDPASGQSRLVPGPVTRLVDHPVRQRGGGDALVGHVQDQVAEGDLVREALVLSGFGQTGHRGLPGGLDYQRAELSAGVVGAAEHGRRQRLDRVDTE